MQTAATPAAAVLNPDIRETSELAAFGNPDL